MNDPRPSSTSSDAIEQQAAAWVLRQDRNLTPAEQDDFLQWLAADPRHSAALTRHRRNWERLDLLGQWRPEHSPGPNRDLLAPSRERPSRLSRFPRVWAAGAALAAAAALGFFLWPAPAEPPLAIQPAAAPAAVAPIERRTLEDGTVVELNRGTELAIAFTPAERRVQLVRGEAHFTVAHNAARPFFVAAGGVSVRAVGTAFNVRLGAAAVEVLVTEGRVQVSEPAALARSAAPMFLAANQRTLVPLTVNEPAAAVATLSSEEIASRLAWQPRLLDFSAAPLRSIVDEFNRRNAPYHLAIADPSLAELEISANLRSDNVEGFLRLLETGFGVRVERAGQDIILRRR